VRPRTLETHFKMFLGTTPLGWVRRMRLARARQEMLHPGPEDTVTGVALSSGFGQLGRFAADYRRAFGTVGSNERWRLIHGWHTRGFGAGGCRPISGTVTLQFVNSASHFI
jgi:transcriptional regulator GlxA family with amidase domain